jgi:xanthine dehydrogenase YagR molybdenum-binding subunit
MKASPVEPLVGKPLPRVDGHAKVTGAVRYAADFNQPEQTYAVILQSTIGLGRIAAIDDAAAIASPGVIAVISHVNAPKLAYAPNKTYIDPEAGERLHVFQDDRVWFFGQPIAVVVAETLDQAEHAAALLNVQYEAEQPNVRISAPETTTIAPEAGLKPDSRSPADRSRGDADNALSAAPLKVDVTYTIARENHNPMEPHATIAVWNGEHLTLWSKTQFVVNEAAEIAAIFGIPAQNVHVINPYVGGAFGTTLRTWPHVTIAALAAKHVGRPVKLVLTRRQMFSETGFRPYTVQRVAIGASSDGRLQAIVHEGTAETSRYEQYVEGLVPATSFMYSCSNVRTRYRLAPLDVSTPTFMRAPGEASGVFALECGMDEMAVALGIDPVAFRLRNEPEIDEGAGRPFSSRSLRACYEQASARFGWSQRDPRPGSMREDGLLIGWGMSATTFPASRIKATARARIFANGRAEVEAATSDIGPGTYTSMTQIAADALRISPERVRFSLGNSDLPPTPAQGGSTTTSSVGSAVRAACLAAREKFDARNGDEDVEVVVTSEPGEERKRFSFYSFGAVFAEVAIDPKLCMVRVRRIVGAYGVGRVINPRLAHSQCIGGMVGGIGMALMERTVLDERDGRLVNASMADYLVPVNLDIAQLDAIFVDEEDPYVNPLGAKGLGEIGYAGVASAVANAVFHATGQRVRTLPIRIEDLL